MLSDHRTTELLKIGGRGFPPALLLENLLNGRWTTVFRFRTGGLPSMQLKPCNYNWLQICALLLEVGVCVFCLGRVTLLSFLVPYLAIHAIKYNFSAPLSRTKWKVTTAVRTGSLRKGHWEGMIIATWNLSVQRFSTCWGWSPDARLMNHVGHCAKDSHLERKS